MDMNGLKDLGSLLDGSSGEGKPMLIDLSLIKEDPNQPRKVFDEEKLKELAESIEARGVKTPISVHEDKDNPGYYVINHGARRYRASLIAGKESIPSYIDLDHTFLDQVVENIQRDNLTPRETADAISTMIKNGMKKGEIAKKLGKSNSFVSQHVALLELPELIAEAFNSGKVTDVTVINELNTLYSKTPEAVTDLLNNEEEITRTVIRNFKDFLKKEGTQEIEEGSDSEASKKEKKEKEEDPLKLKKAIVQVIYQGQLARLILNKRGFNPGEVWIKFEETGEKECVLCAEISKIEAVIEG